MLAAIALAWDTPTALAVMIITRAADLVRWRLQRPATPAARRAAPPPEET
ncbi:MAG: hypothetical protein WDN25_03845 [Acetobacteraceae bacterium]